MKGEEEEEEEAEEEEEEEKEDDIFSLLICVLHSLGSCSFAFSQSVILS